MQRRQARKSRGTRLPFSLPDPPFDLTRPIPLRHEDHEEAVDWVVMLVEYMGRWLGILWWMVLAEFIIILALVAALVWAV